MDADHGFRVGQLMSSLPKNMITVKRESWRYGMARKQERSVLKVETKEIGQEK